MKNLFLFASCLLAATVSAALPTVSDVSLAATADGQVNVNYCLANADAVITVRFLTNGVYLGEAETTALSGDVNRVVTSDTALKTATWLPRVSWRGNQTQSLTAEVRAWALSDTPDYLVLDLCTNAVLRCRYYVSTNALPGGLFAEDPYRTSAMLFRRVSATATTSGFYLGVFEFTKGQLAALEDGYRQQDPSAYNNETCWRYRPVCRVSAQSMLGTRLPRITSRLGLTLELPSGAEWEVAARAGHDGDTWGDGSSATADNLKRLARFSGTCTGWSGSIYGDDTVNTASVGTYAPNDWGFYDMHGNVQEATSDIDDATSKRIYRGGYFASAYTSCKVTSTAQWLDSATQSEYGYRFKLTTSLGEDAEIAPVASANAIALDTREALATEATASTALDARLCTSVSRALDNFSVTPPGMQLILR